VPEPFAEPRHHGPPDAVVAPEVIADADHCDPGVGIHGDLPFMCF
jgi:hypothetical protein